ncbi:MAG: type II toxin-antitoxin system VapC family toxin [Ardenticatenaceae bacterium]|nr:type II toxin-antitoxin system VapC family toxin [Ardenticatenaceae bacterium]
MAVYYFDTSALVKRYAQEAGTAWVMNLTDPAIGHDIYIVRITGPEMVAALFRKVRTGEITPADAARATANFRTDFRTQYQIVEVTPSVADRAMTFAQQHSLRGYDAVQLAAAVELVSYGTA